MKVVIICHQADKVSCENEVKEFVKLNYPTSQIGACMTYEEWLGRRGSLNENDTILAYKLTSDLLEELAIDTFAKNYNLVVIPNKGQLLLTNPKISYVDDIPVFNYGYSVRNSKKIQLAIKRFIDIVLSAIALILVCPLLLLVAIGIKLQDRGPVLYSQDRLTLNGKVFKIFKFRSMITDAEKVGGPQFAQKNDSRITPIGSFLRNTRIDELPQLFNVLVGDMSLVGPRPERPEIVASKLAEIPDFNERLKVKAGLTGLAQVEGKYNTDLKDKLLLDILYITRFNLLLDMKIMLKTIWVLFSKVKAEGISD
ncbi:exopolysaccharide biosynthesis polyprenyl glycosylphosphotransferase [Streptococcus respiraculi]|uniref:exopolysaccharide biosynthesis polyprenyl glycosylphosphotransferase n=1 Tax=Streptococcus respiraculi TaxID=2021971 RepID=UPI000E771643|nr:exopolysaccharide biosynthesis polyprenyl glycosylphosphotransferase [Streptococcus respiraculi]